MSPLSLDTMIHFFAQSLGSFLLMLTFMPIGKAVKASTITQPLCINIWWFLRRLLFHEVSFRPGTQGHALSTMDLCGAPAGHGIFCLSEKLW